MARHVIEPVAGARPASLSRLGLGCSRIGSFANPQPTAAGVALVRAALSLGVTVIDTASIYGQGDSERAIGRALTGARDRAFLVTKAGQTFSPAMRALRPLKPLIRSLLARRAGGGQAVTARRESVMRADWRPAALAASLDGSLRRLRTDRVDGFLLHSPPASVARDPAVVTLLAGLVQAGKVAQAGFSCDDRACLDAALEVPGVTLLELPFEMILALGDGSVAEAIRARGITVLAREVIRAQPDRDPLDAVRAAVAHPLVACTLVGTTSPAHLAAAAEAVR